jgi:hypothetical protein
MQRGELAVMGLLGRYWCSAVIEVVGEDASKYRYFLDTYQQDYTI